MATTVLGQDIALPVIISPTGVQAVHPDGEVAVARAAANRGTAMGLSSFASKPVEEVVAANPKTFFQLYWTGVDGRHPGPGGAGQAGRRGRPDRHARLVVLARPRLGHARRSRTRSNLKTMVRYGPQVHRPAALVATPGPGRCGRPTSPCRTWPWPGRAGADVLRRVRGVDGHGAADLAGRGLAARAVGRPVPAQGRHAGRRRQAGGRRRGQRDLGVQPRRQQPRRHAGHDPGAAGGRRTRSATRSRCCSTAACGAGRTWSRRSRWVPAR